MPTLHTERLILSPPTMQDAKPLAELANNPKVSGVLSDSFPSPYTIELAKEFIHYSESKEIFAIRPKNAPEEFMGIVEIILKTGVQHMNGELAYWLGEPFWRQGYMSEAVMQMTVYGFEVLKLHRLFARHYPFNPASGRVLQKCGFRKEAILKEAIAKDGKAYDDHVYGKLCWE